jgi:hypothetical protein
MSYLVGAVLILDPESSLSLSRFPDLDSILPPSYVVCLFGLRCCCVGGAADQ